MSRRRSRLHSELARLAGELESLGAMTAGSAQIEEMRFEALRIEALRGIRDYLLPRLALARPPMLVALVGSTGAGKSTLLNSLAGQVISPAGALRPTTKASRYWTSREHVSWLAPESSHIEIGTHPLLQTMVLIDTPDLDSDLIEHRTEALTVAEQADVVVFVTTASRYGDAVVWATLTRLAANRPVAVILNRTPSRATGARNDLQARLRRAGLGDVMLFTISEQRIAAGHNRLSPQAVQRVAAYLRALPRSLTGVETVANQAAAVLGDLHDEISARNRLEEERKTEIDEEAIRIEEEARKLSRRRWRRGRSAPAEVLQRARELEELRATIKPSIPLDALRSGRQVLMDAEFEGIWSD